MTQVTQYQTPHGHPVEIQTRNHTSDWNTASAILTHDEYRMPTGLTGWALDVGSHIGSWAIGIALDNPELRVLAIEALPENAELIHDNIRANGLRDRVELLNRSASSDTGVEAVRYGNDDTHRFIGDQRNVQPGDEQVRVTAITLDDVVEMIGPIRLLKIDCEGCEFRFLDSPAIGSVHEIVGEYHGPIGALEDLLSDTHTVTHDEDPNFGSFRAVAK